MKFINNQTIIYHPEVDLKFSEYGIEIPIVDDRAFKVFSYLKSLYPELSEISLKDIPSISIHDLERVHNQDYIARLFADYRSLELEMLKTYELIDEEGEYHRYNPHQARLNFEDARNKIMLQVGPLI